jgi:hypothetical protein
MRNSPVTPLDFETTAAWARIVPAGARSRCRELLFLGSEDRHHFVCVAAAPQQLGHHSHRTVDV